MNHPAWDVTVVIRSVHERTEQLCRSLLIADGVPDDQIFIIHEVPFSASMKRAFEIGLQQNRGWTFCLDADVLLCKGALKSLINKADREKDSMLEIQGLVLDKFLAVYRPAGNHLYRTLHLPRAMKNIPEEGTTLKPETTMLHRCLQHGLYFKQVDIIMGLHDYEQYYEDIVRKCFLHAHKHPGQMYQLETWWKESAMRDDDFKVARWGYVLGKLNTDTVFVSKAHAADEIREMLTIKKVQEKSKLESLAMPVEDSLEFHRRQQSLHPLLCEFQNEIFPVTKWNHVFSTADEKREGNSLLKRLLFRAGSEIELMGAGIKRLSRRF